MGKIKRAEVDLASGLRGEDTGHDIGGEVDYWNGKNEQEEMNSLCKCYWSCYNFGETVLTCFCNRSLSWTGGGYVEVNLLMWLRARLGWGWGVGQVPHSPVFLYVLALQSLKSNQRWKYRNSDDDLMSLLTKTLCFRLRSSHKDEQFHTSLWMKIQRNQCWLTCEQAFGHPDEGKLHFKRRTGHSRPESCGLWCLHHFHGVNLSLRTRPGYVSA